MANIKTTRITSILLLTGLLAAACQGPAPIPTAAATALPSPTSTDPTAVATDPPAPAATPEPESPLGVKPEDLRKGTASFWFTGSEAEAEALRGLAMRFNASNSWGLWIDPVFIGSYGELSDRVTAAVGSDSLPEIVQVYPEIALGWEDEKQLVTDLAPYVDDPVWGMSPADQADFYPALWRAAAIDGRRVGIPAPQSAGILFYNQGWAQELGFNRPPETPAEFKEQACAAAQANQKDESWENDGTGGWIVRGDALTAQSWIAAFGGQVSPDGGKTYTFDTPQARSAFSFLQDLVEGGCAWVSRSPDSAAYLAGRNALIYAGAPADAAAQGKAAESSKIKDAWALIPFPGVDGNPAVVGDGPVYALLQKTPEKQLAGWLFIRWLSQPENQAELVRAGGQLPARAAVAGQLDGYLSEYPQWAEMLSWLPQEQAGPNLPSWITIRPVLGDAAFQFFNPNAKLEPAAGMLARLQQTTMELLERQP